MITSDEIIAQAITGIKRFGTYAYEDKGPNNVMSISEIVKELRPMPVERVVEILKDIAESKELEALSVDSRPISASLIHCMEDWEELFESDPIIGELYDHI